jgi:nucleolin
MEAKATSARARKRRREDAGSKHAHGEGAGSVEEGAHSNPTERTVYLEGLPFATSEDEIVTFCSAAGPVSAVRAPRWQDSGRLRGYAHVEFMTRAGAKAALELSGMHIGARFITVAAAKADDVAAKVAAAPVRPRPQSCTTVFARGLPYEADEAEVKTAFASFGAILSVRIARNPVSQVRVPRPLPCECSLRRLTCPPPSLQVSKGFGYVQFEHGFSADACMKGWRGVGGIKVAGRAVTGLDWDTGAPKASFRAGDGRFYNKTEEGAAAVKALPHSSRGQVGKSGTKRDAGAQGNGPESEAAADPAAAARKKAKYSNRKAKGGKGGES